MQRWEGVVLRVVGFFTIATSVEAVCSTLASVSVVRSLVMVLKPKMKAMIGSDVRRESLTFLRHPTHL